ncbi:MAG: hypothetical protein M1825_004934 [Sarcosagium campestre]|nr:MAG: hypothetical protein M1825_004934 [Sarcosagium campestre]
MASAKSSHPPAPPPLSTSLVTSPQDRLPALRLIADGVAQQRQLASRALIFSPLTLTCYVGLLAVLAYHFDVQRTWAKWPQFVTTAAGITVAALTAVRWACQGYIDAAEELGPSWLAADDQVLATTFGDRCVGTLVMSFDRDQKLGRVKAWTVERRYRGQGLGRDLLVQALEISRQQMGDTAGLMFDKSHVYSKRVLPSMFNTGFDARERQAWQVLTDVLEDADASTNGKKPI